jgi:hypothetical protein
VSVASDESDKLQAKRHNAASKHDCSLPFKDGPKQQQRHRVEAILGLHERIFTA